MLSGMSKAKLINQICPTNAVYDCFKNNCKSCSYCTNTLIILLNEYDKQVKETTINDFTTWLDDVGYLNEVNVNYDWDENPFKMALSIPKTRVIEEYKEYLEQLDKE